MRSVILAIVLMFSVPAMAGQEYLVKLKNQGAMRAFATQFGVAVGMKPLNFNNWIKVSITDEQLAMLENHPGILEIEPNLTFKIQTNLEVYDPVLRGIVASRSAVESQLFNKEGTDNPDMPITANKGTGSDPQFDKQWGMIDNGVKDAWRDSGTKGSRDVVVAVLDTGVDYTHEDLVYNMWRNPGEDGVDSKGVHKSKNGVDDDNNGYIDDYMGWDFGRNDNKPYDLHKTGLRLLLGGNPGHGTHCAGNVAAVGDNGKGIAGVAPNVKIMAMRFLTEDGQGTLEGAVSAIKYAVDNGAQILSNSWGSEGDGGDQQASKALQEAIEYARDNNVLFVAAAGNGHQGVGYDNDTDAKPGYPASYSQENIISVAALDENDALGAFSNWGQKTVDIGAPGVKVYSTVPDNVYQDTVINIPGFIVATWDGTSMATPHVAGAAALYLSKHPQADWQEIKNAILKTAQPIGALSGKAVSEGKLDVKALMNF